MWTYIAHIYLVQIAAVAMASEAREGNMHIPCAVFSVCMSVI
jgi:hypothetical protein